TGSASGAGARSTSSASRRSRGRSSASTASRRVRAGEVVSEPLVPRVLVLVCDSFGVGDAPDGAAYGDEGSNTIGNCARAVGGIRAPNLGALGLGLLTEVAGVPPQAADGSAHGRLTEQSGGKDTTTGHWEMSGVVLDRPFPRYPNGFPSE